MLAFTSVYFFGSGLFNGLQPIQIKNFFLLIPCQKLHVLPAPHSSSRAIFWKPGSVSDMRKFKTQTSEYSKHLALKKPADFRGSPTPSVIRGRLGAATRRSWVQSQRCKPQSTVPPSDDFSLRNRRRRRRIATNKKSTTSAMAAVGAASARKEISAALPSSAVAMTGLPRPPVRTVEWARRIPVNRWVSPATPPPAMTAAVHFTIGGASIMTAADTIVPATKAAGVATASSRLSTTGM